MGALDWLGRTGLHWRPAAVRDPTGSKHAGRAREHRAPLWYPATLAESITKQRSPSQPQRASKKTTSSTLLHSALNCATATPRQCNHRPSGKKQAKWSSVPKSTGQQRLSRGAASGLPLARPPYETTQTNKRCTANQHKQIKRGRKQQRSSVARPGALAKRSHRRSAHSGTALTLTERSHCTRAALGARWEQPWLAGPYAYCVAEP